MIAVMFILMALFVQNPVPPGPPLQEFYGKLLILSEKPPVVALEITRKDQRKTLPKTERYVLRIADDKILSLKTTNVNVKVTGRLYPATKGPIRIEPYIKVEKIEMRD